MPALTKLVITFDPGEPHLRRLRQAFPDIEIVECLDRKQLSESLPGAQALVGGGITAEHLAQFKELRWIHSQGTGVDGVLFPELIASDIVVTNNSGVQASNMAEHLLAMMLAFARGLPELIRAQARSEWVQPLRAQSTNQKDFYEHETFELGYQTLAIVGLGSVGRALAARATGLGMTVIGYKRDLSASVPHVDFLYGPDNLRDMLAAADHVAICLPLTADTRQMIAAPELEAMKSTAFFYNVGRGETVDQDALIKALQAGEIAGAGLDVTSPEPLPSDSPLWQMPNVMITSHTSGLSPHRWERGIDLLMENIHRYRNDEPLRNVVDKHAGY